jgi:hypothetical protein
LSGICSGLVVILLKNIQGVRHRGQSSQVV